MKRSLKHFSLRQEISFSQFGMSKRVRPPLSVLRRTIRCPRTTPTWWSATSLSPSQPPSSTSYLPRDKLISLRNFHLQSKNQHKYQVSISRNRIRILLTKIKNDNISFSASIHDLEMPSGERLPPIGANSRAASKMSLEILDEETKC